MAAPRPHWSVCGFLYMYYNFNRRMTKVTGQEEVFAITSKQVTV
jgi:hypothetical protein